MAYSQAEIDAVVQALNSGAVTAEQLSQIYGVPASEIEANLAQLNQQSGYTPAQPTTAPYTPPIQTTAPAATPPATQAPAQTPTNTIPSGAPQGAATGNTSADWGAIEQGNADWRNSIQSGIFNNPNITLADGSTQTTSYGNLPDYAAYVRNNPDLLADFNGPNNPFKDMAAYGKYHWESSGQAENRQMPTGSPAELGFLQPETKVNLSPQEQAIYDADQRIRGNLASLSESQLGRVADSFNSTLSDSNLVDPTQYMGTNGLYDFKTDPSVGGFNQVRDDLIAREQPQFDRKRQSLENDLLVRGLNPGTESWNNRFDDLNRAENDFSLAATQYAGQEQNRLFDMEGQRRQQGFAENDASYGQARDWRQNQINEALTARNLPLNELNALKSGTQIGLPNMTPYQGTGFTAPNFAGAEQENYNRQFVKDQQDQQNKNAMTTGLFQLGGAALGAGGAAGGFGKLFGY